MTAEGVEAGGLRSKMGALREKFCSARVEAFVDLFAVVVPAEQGMTFERHATKREPALALVQVKRKLKFASVGN